MKPGFVLLLVTFLALSAQAVAQPAGPPAEPRELIYCADRMTPEEREAYRARMRAARTLEERQAIRAALVPVHDAVAACLTRLALTPPEVAA